jgi:hypothetical protein
MVVFVLAEPWPDKFHSTQDGPVVHRLIGYSAQNLQQHGVDHGPGLDGDRPF